MEYNQTPLMGKNIHNDPVIKQPVQSVMSLIQGSKIEQYTVEDFALINISSKHVKNTVFQ